MENKETTIILKLDKDSAEKGMLSFKGEVEDTKTQTEGLNDNLNKTPKTAKGASRGIKLVGGATKALGVAFKALGLGLIIGLVARLTEVFQQNQTVVDGFNKIMTTVDIVLGGIVDVVVEAYEAVTASTNEFDALGKVMDGLITMVLAPYKLAWDGIKLGLQQATLIWQKSPFGSGDDKSIKKLEESIEETKQSIKDTAKETEEAAISIKDNIGDAVDEVSDAAVDAYDAAAEEISKIDVAQATAQAERLVEFRKRVRIQEALIEGITAKYQQQAEEQRQIRDNEEASIEDRIKANQRVAEILEKQGQEELSVAQQRINLIQEEIAAGDDSIEKEEELIQAKNARNEIEESINGQLSEQKTNEVALRKEREENLAELNRIGKTALQNSIQDAEEELKARRKLIDRTVKDGEEKNKLLTAAQRDYDNTIDEINQENVKKLVDFEQEYRLQARLEQAQSEEEEYLIKREKERERFEEELAEIEGQEERKAELIKKFDQETEKAKEDFAKQREERQRTLAKSEVDMSIQAADAIINTLAEGSELAKGFSVAKALFNTYEGIAKALGAETLPQRIAGVAFATATGFGAVQDILSTDPSGGNASASGGSANAPNQQQQAPRFDLTEPDTSVEGDNVNKVYVTSEDVSTQQSLDRNRERNSRFI